MASVAMKKAVEIVSRSISDITMVTLEALDLAGYCYGENNGSYPTQLPWLRGRVFNTTETFRGIHDLVYTRE